MTEKEIAERARLRAQIEHIHKAYEGLDASHVAVWPESQPPVFWTGIVESVLEVWDQHQTAVLDQYRILFESLLKKVGVVVNYEKMEA